jgi:hypothetical protein
MQFRYSLTLSVDLGFSKTHTISGTAAVISPLQSLRGQDDVHRAMHRLPFVVRDLRTCLFQGGEMIF